MSHNEGPENSEEVESKHEPDTRGRDEGPAPRHEDRLHERHGSLTRDEPEGGVDRLRSGSLGRREPDLESGDGFHPEGHQDSIPGLEFTYVRQAPLPPVEEFAGYEQVLSGAAHRILRMAEKSQDARVAAEMVPIYAEATALKIASIAWSLFPAVAYAATVALAFAGLPVGAALTGVAGTVAVAPQVIREIRAKRE
ncbi:DUF2335 domain-containing protein [Pseudactinotalea sp. HY158]|uniref:DUF2335 domain-containing protein n=1 Tax=Pseudactinotalea sp. HY158 TaxID=2654547 RepID=UPI00129CD5D4|nr:DUF2335 domain-containing protein [Pseudactinotalea sp. HY158]QGH70017.1 DUF2335 domain-containing protein [Pseudactinotalea sp. HY158]